MISIVPEHAIIVILDSSKAQLGIKYVSNYCQVVNYHIDYYRGLIIEISVM